MSNIEYLEIRELTSQNTLNFIGIVDEFQSLIWHTCFNKSGDFEIYAPLNENNDTLLKIGNFVSRSDRNDNVTENAISYPKNDLGIIESITKSFDIQNGYMITASGRMVDSILDRRIIIKLDKNGKPNPTTLKGNIQEQLNSMIGTQLTGDRNIPLIRNFATLLKSEIAFPDERQVTYNNLLEYVQSTLQEFNLGIRGQLWGNVIRLEQYAGRETDLIFSTEYDNLISCTYSVDESTLKTTALVGAEGEGTERAIKWVNNEISGYERLELFVDDTSITKTYTDDEGNEQTYTDTQFQAMLNERGSLELSKNQVTTSVEGELNITSSGIEFRKDFYLGDVVTITDNVLGIQVRVRVSEVTEVQDSDGYTIDMVFGG